MNQGAQCTKPYICVYKLNLLLNRIDDFINIRFIVCEGTARALNRIYWFIYIFKLNYYWHIQKYYTLN